MLASGVTAPLDRRRGQLHALDGFVSENAGEIEAALKAAVSPPLGIGACRRKGPACPQELKGRPAPHLDGMTVEITGGDAERDVLTRDFLETQAGEQRAGQVGARRLGRIGA